MRLWPCSTRTLPRLVVCSSVVAVNGLSFRRSQATVSGPRETLRGLQRPPYRDRSRIRRLHHVRGFAVHLLVEPPLLCRIGDAHGGDHVDRLQHRVREENRVGGAPETRGDLFPEEGTRAGDQSLRTRGVDRGGAENAEQDDPEQATDTVHTPDVERVVPAHPLLELDREVADATCG